MNKLPSIEKVITDLIAETNSNAGLLDVRIGAHFTCVHTEAGAGLASTLRSKCTGKKNPAVRQAGKLLELSQRSAAQLALSSSLLEASLGIAAITSTNVKRADECVDKNAADVIAELGSNRHVAVIGSFPFARTLNNTASHVSVFEQPDHRRPGQLGPEDMASVLPKADVVACSATTLINHTLIDVLRHVRSDAALIMLGPSTPLSPVLFDLGFDVLSTSLVQSPELALVSVSQGANFRQIQGIRLVTLTRE